MTMEREICRPICLKPPGHRREFLAAPKDTQSDLGITRLERIRLITCASGRDSKELFEMSCQTMGRCGFRPQSPGSMVEAQTEEELTSMGNQYLI